MTGSDSDSDPRWEAFAAREPYFAVMTAPRFLRANLTPDREREFFAGGEQYVEWLVRLIGERLVPEFAPMSTLEYGCGVGRLAIPFARRAGAVTAVDRSPVMLETARRESERRDAAHIEFQTPKELFATGRRFELVNCYGVLQRMPPAEGLVLLRRLADLIGAGGVGVFHFPYRTTTSRLVATTRWARARLPAINAILNIVRGKPIGEPFIASHSYNLDDVFRVLDDAFRARYGAPIAASHLLFEHQDGLAAAIAFVEAPRVHRNGSRPPPRRVEPIDVRQMIAQTSVEELSRSAEEYFSTLPDWEHHLAKPFSNAEEAPRLLTAVATLLQGLRPAAGMTVLEFGAGSGWLSHALTQVGCRVILLDVSASALEIARELYRRQPIVGDRPRPEFLTFDGRHVDLPDGSVDRIVSFHAFHHVPNPDAVLREFGRLLKPGGIAGFSEPGPRHSLDPRSQFDMRAHRVVENDIDIHALWRIARSCGFADLKLALYHGPAFHVSLAGFEAFLADSGAGEPWVNSTRAFLRHVRTFFLYKEGVERVDSRSLHALGCRIDAVVAGACRAQQPILIDVTVSNSGTAVWLPPDAASGGVTLGAHLYSDDGKLITFDFHRQAMSAPAREIVPGEMLTMRVALPPQAPGRYLIELDCVAANVTWFAQVGSLPARIVVDVRAD
jgi:2-polyprenyl-3-methyl-5-hydroxy-6-metoxy-1,4-benzoquinol methylase